MAPPYALPSSAVWFITGCSSGIGHTLSTYLLQNTPHRVIATARDPTSLSSLPTSPNVLKLALDVTSEASVAAALAATLKTYGRIDVLVNNAGYGMHAHTELVALPAAQALMATNFWGAVRLTQLVLPIMRDTNALDGGSRGGLVLQVSSVGGRLAFPGGAFYHASKFALEGFTEAISKEMPDAWGIHFLLLEPGGVQTQYAETSTRMAAAAETSSDDRVQNASSSVYADASLPANVLRAYVANPEARRAWADVNRVVEVLYGVVAKGGELPLRLPLGSDAHGMMVQGAETVLKDLEAWKGVSCSTSGGEQLDSVKFLKIT